MFSLINPNLNEHETQLLLHKIELRLSETQGAKLSYTSPKALLTSLTENNPKEEDTWTICICDIDEEIPLSIIRKVDFFVSRPITEEQMVKVVGQIEEQKTKDLLYAEYSREKKKYDVISYPQPGHRKYLRVHLKDILWLEAEDTMTIFYLNIRGENEIRKAIVKFSDCLKRLPQRDFFETHRGIAVRRSALADTNNRRMVELRLNGGGVVKLARRRTKNFWNWWNFVK